MLDWFKFRAYLKSPHIDPVTKKPSGRIFLQEHERNAREYGRRYLSSFMDEMTAEDVGVDIMHDAARELEKTLRKKVALKKGENFYGYFNSLVISRVIDRSRKLKSECERFEKSRKDFDWMDDYRNELSGDNQAQDQGHVWESADLERVLTYLKTEHKGFEKLVIGSFREDADWKAEIKRLGLTLPAAKKKCRAVIRQMQEHFATPRTIRIEEFDDTYYLIHPVLQGKADRWSVSYHHHGTTIYIDDKGESCAPSHIINSKDKALKAVKRHQRK